MRRRKNRSTLTKQQEAEVNDLPGQYLGRTLGNMNGFDAKKSGISLNEVLQ